MESQGDIAFRRKEVKCFNKNDKPSFYFVLFPVNLILRSELIPKVSFLSSPSVLLRHSPQVILGKALNSGR
ncbi:MAG: hypothetical protein DRJ11_05330 [Candidatus Aminicenantes bacterium]|nr:MAG: hypothetical protein DRJ11_05330 [Candidatus Aminicenantes bacterium]